MDLVHFEGLYQVHHPCPKSPSEPHLVYLVHPLEVDLVHLGATTLLPRTFLFVYCHRASGAAGSPRSSRRAAPTTAPGYAQRWCTIASRHLG